VAFDWKAFFPEEIVNAIRSGWSLGAGKPSLPGVPGISVSRNTRTREDIETRRLYREVLAAQAKGPFSDREKTDTFLIELITDILEERGVAPSLPLGNALWDTLVEFLWMDSLASGLPSEESLGTLSIDQGVELRASLRRQLRFLTDHKRLLPIWRRKLVILFSGMLGYFPASAFADVSEDGHSLDDSIIFPSARAFDLCEKLPEALDRAIGTLFDAEVTAAHLFVPIQDVLNRNIALASGINPNKPNDGTKKVIFPSAYKDDAPDSLVDTYLSNTPLHGFFSAGLPFSIPFPARFEHTHIIGGTGHGKTQLLQFLINHDLVRAKEDGRSVVVIDSQGDLIRTISRLAYFGRDAEGSLFERYVLIDPTDIEHPVALNMFDFNRSRLSGYAPLDREKILNATIELYEYFFGALLGAELTQRQGLIFKYLARLLIEIPGATIHTLRELMENGEKFLPYMEQLTGTTRAFFATRFFQPQFNETKKQILARLWGVLSNAALERMFSHKESKIDLFDMMNSGKIVLINTAKDLLGEEGTTIFGRFFIALIAQAAIQRSAIAAHERTPAFVYIDEAADYFDSNISRILTQARKYKVGLTLAHQNLGQLGAELRDGISSSTSIKFAGGVSASDANTIARELRTESDFLLAQRRTEKETRFACYVKNYTGKALSISVPLGFVESLPTISAEDAEYLREKNQERYSAPPEPMADVEFSFKKAEPKKAKPETKTRDTSAPIDARATLKPTERVAEPLEDVPRPGAPPITPEPSRPSVRAPRAPHADAGRVPPSSGKGGEAHKFYQHLIKGLAEERGFHVTIEAQVLDGTGQVDVSLIRGEVKIACEISVTTRKDHELGNVEKCIAAGYKHILLIGTNEKQVQALTKFIDSNIEDKKGAAITCATPERVPEYLESFGAASPMAEMMVGGRKIKARYKVLPPEEQAQRRKVIAEVLAKSVTKAKK
jgi:hypothetical protein